MSLILLTFMVCSTSLWPLDHAGLSQTAMDQGNTAPLLTVGLFSTRPSSNTWPESDNPRACPRSLLASVACLESSCWLPQVKRAMPEAKVIAANSSLSACRPLLQDHDIGSWPHAGWHLSHMAATDFHSGQYASSAPGDPSAPLDKTEVQHQQQLPVKFLERSSLQEPEGPAERPNDALLAAAGCELLPEEAGLPQAPDAEPAQVPAAHEATSGAQNSAEHHIALAESAPESSRAVLPLGAQHQAPGTEEQQLQMPTDGPADEAAAAAQEAVVLPQGQQLYADICKMIAAAVAAWLVLTTVEAAWQVCTAAVRAAWKAWTAAVRATWGATTAAVQVAWGLLHSRSAAGSNAVRSLGQQPQPKRHPAQVGCRAWLWSKLPDLFSPLAQAITGQTKNMLDSRIMQCCST